MQHVPRITVEVPVLAVGIGPGDYESLRPHVHALRKPAGLHMTVLHLGVLTTLAGEITEWTNGLTSPDEAAGRTVAWLRGLPETPGFPGTAGRLVVLGGGNVSALEVHVPQHIHDYQLTLVQRFRGFLDELLVDNVDDFILASRALGWHPRWIPHVAVGRPASRGGNPVQIPPVAVSFGPSRIRNAAALP